MQKYDSLGAQQLPNENEEEPIKEVWGGKKLSLNAMVYKDTRTDDLIACEDVWKYIAEQIEPELLVEFIRFATKRGTTSRMDLFCYLDLMKVPLHEEVKK